jgi:hypothetical protein
MRIMTAATPKPRARWGTGRIAVTAKWPEIQTALAAGWPMTMIYEKHLSGAEISYSQFRRQVHRLQSAAARITPPDEHTPSSAAPQTGTDNVSNNKEKFRHTGIADPATLRKLTHGR